MISLALINPLYMVTIQCCKLYWGPSVCAVSDDILQFDYFDYTWNDEILVLFVIVTQSCQSICIALITSRTSYLIIYIS